MIGKLALQANPPCGELESWDKLINYYDEDYTQDLFDYIIDNL